MGMDAEALFLIQSSTGWHVASWSDDLPRSEFGGKYDFLGGLDSWSEFPVLVPCQTDRQIRREFAKERAKQSLHYHDEFSQYLCALPGERLAPLNKALAEDWASDIGDNSDWVWACGAAQIALRVAEILDHLTEEDDEVEVPPHFWKSGHYGFFAMMALQLSFGTVSLTRKDITEHFVERSDPRQGALELVRNHPDVLGQVIVQANGDVAGVIWTSNESLGDDAAFDDSTGYHFSGSNVLTVQIAPVLVKYVYVRTYPCVPVSVKLLSSPRVDEDALCNDWAGDRKQLWTLLLTLRRRLVQNAARMVLQYILPHVPALDIAVGFVHDSQTDSDQARIASIEHDDRSKLLSPSGVNDLIDVAAALKRHRCPLTIPAWIGIYGPANLQG